MNTPVEALEISYPLRVERYELIEGTGGSGQHRGGNGVIRALRVLDHDARVSLQSDRRKFKPYGLLGGGEGKSGRNFVITSDGGEQPYPGKATLTLGNSDVVVVETPGGGGWGKA
jgi:N-methylhydantoinase B